MPDRKRLRIRHVQGCPDSATSHRGNECLRVHDRATGKIDEQGAIG
jgi:hypothetical protein